MNEIRALAHAMGDYVAVAVEDIKKGESVSVAYLDSSKVQELVAQSDVPLGHKLALLPIKLGQDIIEYGYPIGVATREIMLGEHVHVHNIKSKRW